MSNGKLAIALRWMCTLPCAWLASLSAYLLMFLCSGFSANKESLMMIYILPLICSYISGFAFMTVGILLAPSHTRMVALTLSAILLIILRMGMLPVCLSKENLASVQCVITVAGSAIAYFSLRNVVEG